MSSTQDQSVVRHGLNTSERPASLSSDEARCVQGVIQTVDDLELSAPRKRKLMELLENSVRTDEGIRDEFTRKIFRLGRKNVFDDFDELSPEGKKRVLGEIDDNVRFFT